MDLVKGDLGCSVSDSVKGPSTVWVAGLQFLSVVVRISLFISRHTIKPVEISTGNYCHCQRHRRRHHHHHTWSYGT